MAIKWIDGSTVAFSATTSSASVTIASPTDVINTWALVSNDGPSTVMVKFGVGAQTATTASIPIPPATAIPIFIPSGSTGMGVITATGTATGYVCMGRE